MMPTESLKEEILVERYLVKDVILTELFSTSRLKAQRINRT